MWFLLFLPVLWLNKSCEIPLRNPWPGILDRISLFSLIEAFHWRFARKFQILPDSSLPKNADLPTGSYVSHLGRQRQDWSRSAFGVCSDTGDVLALDSFSLFSFSLFGWWLFILRGPPRLRNYLFRKNHLAKHGKRKRKERMKEANMCNLDMRTMMIVNLDWVIGSLNQKSLHGETWFEGKLLEQLIII